MTVETVSAVSSFDGMNLSEPLRRALQEVGYVQPTAVQTAVFEPVVAGRDVIVQSKTGSGKTAAFAIPLLDRVVQPGQGVQVLVLCPTRELALQVTGEFSRLGKHKGVVAVAIYGGTSITQQTDELRAGPEVVCGTPGRVLDHLRRGTLDVRGLKAIVLDEADEMLSMGFAEEVQSIFEFLPQKRQGLFFSATIPEEIQRLAGRHLTHPEFISLSDDHIAPAEIEHYVYFVGLANRTRELARILEVEKPDSAIVFCNTRDETVAVVRELQRLGLDADLLSGDLEQPARERVLRAFRRGEIKYLVATDVAARGIDISGVSHVINYGFPESAETYVHRTGRTGRAGRRGTAISLIGPGDVGNLYLLRLTYGIRPIERALPSAAEERTRREIDRINLLREAFTSEPSEEALSLARRLLTHDDADKIVACLLAEFFDLAARQAIAQSSPAKPATASVTVSTEAQPQSTVRVDAAKSVETRPAERPARRGRSPVATSPARAPERPRRIRIRGDESALEDEEPDTGMEEIRLAVGRRDGVRAGELARLIRDKAGLSRHDLGRIFVRDRFTLVSVREDRLQSTIEALRDVSIGDRPLDPEPSKSLRPTVPPVGSSLDAEGHETANEGNE